MMAVDVHAGEAIRLSRARGLFEDSYEAFGNTPSFDVLPDGQHFVMVETNLDLKRTSHFNLVLNWFEELKRLVPPK